MVSRMAATCLAFAVLAGGCTSATPSETGAEHLEAAGTTGTVSVITSSSQPTTTAATAATTSSTAAPPSIPPVPEPGEPLAEPRLLTSVVDGFLVAAQSASVLLWMEPTTRSVPGCEADTDPASRFFRQELTSGRERTLFEQTDDERWFPIVHHSGRVALLTGCDANGWLDGVGTLEPDGSFNKTLRGDQLVFYGNNAPLSVTWTADGEILFLNSWHINGRTAEIIDGPESGESDRAVRAVLAGETLVLETGTGEGLTFELVSGDGTETLNAVEGDGWNLPVEIAGDGANAVIRFTEFGQVEGARSVILGSVGSVELAGLAWFAPSGDRILIQRDDLRWDIADLNGEVVHTLQLSDPAGWVEWTHDGRGLVIQTARSESEASTTVSYTDVPPRSS